MVPSQPESTPSSSAGDERRDRTWSRPREAVAMFVRGATVRTAGPTALIVGTILSLVNQGAVVTGGHSDGGTWVRVMVNFVVPFCVASVGFLSARRVRPGGHG